MADNGQQPGTPAVDRTRNLLAYVVLFVCAIGIIVFATVAILAADNRDAITRLVFVSVLPLFGTWVGTVLAFYFTSRNLEAATASTRSLTEASARLAGVATPTTLVRERMIPWAEMKVFTLTDAEAKDVTQVPLDKLWAELEKLRPRDRLPLVGPDRTLKGLVHGSLLTGYAARLTGQIPTVLQGKTVKNLSDEEKKLLLETVAFVAADATLNEARTRMRVVPRCHDVIATDTGVATEPVLGWLTDSDLAALPD
jgi:uncharacterized integral membrane protein